MPKGKAPAKPVKVEAPSQVLPSKDAASFKQILKLYETKKYPKALKLADQILKKFPEHGETLAMKGLINNSLKKKDDAEVLVKKGLALNPKSHVCWHVYGLLHRSNRNYDAAIKCYQQAINIDKDNLQILKDLSNLQVQRRMYSGFQETRRRILILKANNKQNWLAYAIGTHLSGNYKKCVEIMDSYSKASPDRKGQSQNGMQAYEDSEFLLYRNMVLEESGDIEGTLKHLESIEHDIVDKLYWREKRAKLMLSTGKIKEAEAEYRALLEVNPEESNFHFGLRRCLGLTGDQLNGEQTEKLIQLYDELQKQFPKSQAAIRRPLDFLSGSSEHKSSREHFKTRVDSYLRHGLRKGLPSLFRDIRPLYTDVAKVAVVENLFKSYLTELRTNSRFRTSDEPDSEVPSALLFTLMFASEHYDHQHNYSESLKLVNEAIAHTPTNLDLYVLRARIYKHAGDMETAFHWMDFARKLDTADRYLNTKCVRYALRADRLQDAQRIVSYFLRDGDSLTSLYDMQCMWYENNVADSYIRQKEWGRALRKWHAVDEHFDTIFEDQFDFHNYCLRKMTLRAYIDMLRWQDTLRSHRFYFRAAHNLVKTYLRLYDNPALADKNKALNDKNLTEEEKQQLKKELRAAKKKEFANKEGDDKNSRSDTEKLGNQIAGKKGDDDPDGVKLVQTKDPLGDANKFLKHLQLYRPDDIETQLLAVQVYTRKKKYLLVLKALKKALTLNPHDPQANLDLISTLHTLKSVKLDPIVQQVVDLECKSDVLGGNQTPTKLIENFLQQNGGSLNHRFAAAKAHLALETKGEEKLDLKTVNTKTKQRVIELINPKLKELKIQPLHQDCRPIYEYLLTIDQTAASDFKSQCSTLFPLTPFFNDEKKTTPGVNEDKYVVPKKTEVKENGEKASEASATSEKQEENGSKGSKKIKKVKKSGNKSRTSSETA